MKLTVKIYRYIAVAFLTLTLTTVPVFSQAVPDKAELSGSVNQQASQELVNSGDNVEAEQKQDAEHDTRIENETQQATEQSTTVNANTGNNTAERNISIGGNAGTIETGNVGVVSNAAAGGATNTTAVAPPGGSGGGGSSTTAVNSGDNVGVSSDSSTSTNTGVQNTNNTNTSQSTTVNANTGNNRADRNIAIGGGTAGAISTGSVGVYSNQLVTPGGNVTLIGGSGSGSGSGNGPGSGASIRLANAGDNVRANSSTSNSSNTSVENLNNQFISQLTYVNADTGNNTANRNIAFGGDAGVIHTGNIGVGVTYVVDGSENATVVAGGGSSGGAGGSSVDALNTGDNVDVSSDSESETNTSVSNSNNTVINQTAFINANTGGNVANRNIAFGGTAGGISTGNVGVQVQFFADLSKNKTVVHPTTNTYHYIYPTPALKAVTEPTPQPQQAAPSYRTRVQPVYYYVPSRAAAPAGRTQNASYVAASGPLVKGTSMTRDQSKTAGQKNPITQTVQAGMFDTVLSHLLVMAITFLVVALRKPVRV